MEKKGVFMNGEKRNVLLNELVNLANEGHFFVSMETDSKFFRGLAPATPRVCVGVLLSGDSARPTVTAGPMLSDYPLPNNGSIVYRALTDEEKDEICTILTNIAQKAGVHFRLLKVWTRCSDGLLYYRFA
jgi:hypothetical protein